MEFSGLTWRKASYSASGANECVEVGVWRKASYSASRNNECVEVGVWHKASYSASGGDGNCVEVGMGREAGCVGAGPEGSGIVAVRDSKDPSGPVLPVTAGGWQAFTAQVKAGAFDLI